MFRAGLCPPAAGLCPVGMERGHTGGKRRRARLPSPRNPLLQRLCPVRGRRRRMPQAYNCSRVIPPHLTTKRATPPSSLDFAAPNRCLSPLCHHRTPPPVKTAFSSSTPPQKPSCGLVNRRESVLTVRIKPPPSRFVSPAPLHVSISTPRYSVLASCQVQKPEFFLSEKSNILSSSFPVSSWMGTAVCKRAQICLASCLHKQV